MSNSNANERELNVLRAELARIASRMGAVHARRAQRRTRRVAPAPPAQRIPVLAPTANMTDPIFYTAVSPNNAWYIRKNVSANGKIFHVYKKSTLNQILTMPPEMRKSPMSRVPITRDNIRKLSNHSGNTIRPRAFVIRPRRGSQFTALMFDRFKRMLDTGSITRLKIWVRLPPGHAAVVHFFNFKKMTTGRYMITYQSGQVYSANVPGEDIVTTLETFVTTTFGVGATFEEYKSYR